MTQVKCRMCGANALSTVCRIDAPGREGEFRACAECEAWSFFPEGSAPTYAPEYYGRGITRVGGLAGWIRSRCAVERANRVRKVAGSTGSCLDIGCGDGTFLCTMARSGWEVAGTELPGPAFDRSRARLGSRIREASEFPSAWSGAQLDAITLWQVFEHLDHPTNVLESCRNLLRPGGWLMLGVPNPDSWQSRWGGQHWLHLDSPRHLHLEGPEGLKRAVDRCGFEVVRVFHPWAEYGVIGWVQTALNRFGWRRDGFFESLCQRENPQWSETLAAAAVLPGATLAAIAEALARRAATYEIFCRLGTSARESLSPAGSAGNTVDSHRL